MQGSANPSALPATLEKNNMTQCHVLTSKIKTNTTADDDNNLDFLHLFALLRRFEHHRLFNTVHTQEQYAPIELETFPLGAREIAVRRASTVTPNQVSIRVSPLTLNVNDKKLSPLV